jgi:hypothetical protein
MIPAKFGIAGKVLELAGDDGWTVVTAGRTAEHRDFREKFPSIQPV